MCVSDWVRGYRGVGLFCFWLLPLLCVGSEIDWDPESRTPVRTSILGCHTFLSPAEPEVNDSVGIRVSSNQIDEFRTELTKVIQQHGRDRLRGGHFFVTGVAMDEERTVRKEYESVLEELGFKKGEVRVRVLSIPRQDVKLLSLQAVRSVFQRLLYLFPSIKRDYQKPTREEVVSGLVSAAIIEVPNVIFLYSVLDPIDAHLTVAAHTTLLVVYSVFKKFMINWLLRPGKTFFESFLQQASLSMPFILNYNLFGNFSKITQFYQEYGWAATLAEFPNQVAAFATTQGFTAILQTLFYQIVVTNGVRGWENSQNGSENSLIARQISNYLLIPILAVDAVALAMAASPTTSAIFELGPMAINYGHAFLAGITTLGAALWKWPEILNPSISAYKALNRFWTPKTTPIETSRVRRIEQADPIP